MMKNAIYTTLLIIASGIFPEFGLPWWLIAPAAALAAFLFPLRAGAGFATAFAAGYLLWYGHAFVLDSANSAMLSGKVGQLFLGLKSWQLLAITGLIGGLLAGGGMMTGYYARQLFVVRKQNH